MDRACQPLDLLFLGSGNAFGAEGRAFSSFLLNGRYLFDCGPTVLQQLTKAGLSTNDIDAIFISHFHADHFFGLPFFFLDARYGGRTRDITIVGPPGIERVVDDTMAVGYPHLLDDAVFRRRYVEVSDGCRQTIEGLDVEAAQVTHVSQLECFAFRATVDGRSVVYSGDTTLCDPLVRLAEGADVLVLECTTKEVPVHLSPSGIAEVASHAPAAKVIVTHLDGRPGNPCPPGIIVAEDLARYRF